MTPPETTQPADRRSFPRYGFPRPGFPPLAATVGFEPSQAGLVQDVSRSGIGFLVSQALEAGSILPVWVPSLTETTSRMLLVRVVRIESVNSGLYRIGARFVDPVSGDLVEPLLDQTV
jgi:hypothetical protein